MTARADAMPGEEPQTSLLLFYSTREELHHLADTSNNADEYDLLAGHLDKQAQMILARQPTCAADVAPQVLTATEHGEHYLTADMIDRLRKLVTEATQ